MCLSAKKTLHGFHKTRQQSEDLTPDTPQVSAQNSLEVTSLWACQRVGEKLRAQSRPLTFGRSGRRRGGTKDKGKPGPNLKHSCADKKGNMYRDNDPGTTCYPLNMPGDTCVPKDYRWLWQRRDSVWWEIRPQEELAFSSCLTTKMSG